MQITTAFRDRAVEVHRESRLICRCWIHSLSFNSRFNAESMTVMNRISALLKGKVDENCDAAVKVPNQTAKIDAEICVSEGRMLFYNDACKKRTAWSLASCKHHGER